MSRRTTAVDTILFAKRLRETGTSRRVRSEGGIHQRGSQRDRANVHVFRQLRQSPDAGGLQMTVRSITSASWLFLGVALVFVSMTVIGLRFSRAPEAVAAPVHDAPAMPFVHATWVKLGDLVPLEDGAEDVYVRLIAIDGAVPR